MERPDFFTLKNGEKVKLPFSNFEYEQNQQDEIRKIRLLDPSYIGQFVNEYKNLMKESII